MSDECFDPGTASLTCFDCGGEMVADIFTERVEVGDPTNRHSRGAVAPSYGTEVREVTVTECQSCGKQTRDERPP